MSVERSILRRETRVLINAALGAGQTFTSPWFDSNADGTNYIEIIMLAAASIASGAALIQGSDDQTTIFTIAGNSSATSPGTAVTYSGPLLYRYYRFTVPTVGAQSNIKVTMTGMNIPPLSGGFLSFGNTGFRPLRVAGSGDLVVTPINGLPASDGVSAEVCSNPAAGANAMPVTALAKFVPTTGASITALIRTPQTFKNIAAVAVVAGTPQTVWTPAAGKKFRLMGYTVSLSVAGSVIFIDNATEIIRTPLMPAGIGQACPPGMDNGILSAVAVNPLKIDVTANGSVSGFVFGVEE